MQFRLGEPVSGLRWDRQGAMLPDVLASSSPDSRIAQLLGVVGL